MNNQENLKMQSLVPFEKRQINKLDDFLISISELGFSNPPEIRKLFSNPELIKDSDPKIAPIVYCGYGKIYLVSGHFSQALKYYRDALELIHSQTEKKSELTRNDIFAYVHNQVAVFYKVIGDKPTAKNHFNIAKLFVESDLLKSVIDYNLATVSSKDDKNESVQTIKECIEKFKKLDLKTYHVMAMHKLGVLYASFNEFDNAERLYQKSLQLSQRYEFKYHIYTNLNSLGFLEYKRGNYELALGELEKIKFLPESFYTKSLIIENMALCYERMEKYSKAMDHWMESLNICEDHGVITNIPEDCFRIGSLYENYIFNLQKAKYFYKKGYLCSMEMVSQDIKLVGFRYKVVQKYNNFLIDQQSGFNPTIKKEPIIKEFPFARDKKWKDIKNLIQYNAIIFYKYKYKSIELAIQKLSMKRTTFNAVQRRLKEKGFKIPDFRCQISEFKNENIFEDIHQYLSDIKTYDWKTLNHRFEKEVLEFLLADKKVKKNKLSKMINISYANLTFKTRYNIESFDNPYSSK